MDQPGNVGTGVPGFVREREITGEESLAPAVSRDLTRRWEKFLPLGLILATWLSARVFRFWGLGLYWDDWRIFTRGMEGGAAAIFSYLAGERLLMGLPHALLYSIFGPEPLAWHASNVFLELGSACLIYATLRRALPGYAYLPVLVACLYLAYPLSVIRTHMINVYINTALFLALLSLCMTAQLLRGPQEDRGKSKPIFVLLGALLIPLYLLMYEMPVGFEVIRLWILWKIVSDRLPARANFSQHLLGTIKAYVPYFGGLLIFLLAKVFIYPRVASSLSASLRGGLELASLGRPDLFEAMMSFAHILLAAWINAFESVVSLSQPYHWSRLNSWIMGGVVAGILVWGLTDLAKRRPPAAETDNPLRSWAWLLAGALASMAALLLPFWMHPAFFVFYTNLASRNGYFATIPAALFCLCFLAALGRFILPREVRSPVFLVLASALVGLGVAFNQLLTDQWIEEWRHTRATWQQIVTRVPDLAKGTLLVLSQPKDFKAFRVSLRGRDIYEPAQLFYELPFGEVYGSPITRNTETILPWLSWGDWQEKVAMRPVDPILHPIRRDAILALDETQGSIKVLDRGAITNQPDAGLSLVAAFSNPSRIQAGASGRKFRLRERLLGTPPRDWALYYALAGWARQRKAWAELTELYTEVKKRKLRPDHPVEWLPFLEGLARNGQDAQAREVLTWIRGGPVSCRESAVGLLESIREDLPQAGERAAIEEEIRFLKYLPEAAAPVPQASSAQP